MGQPGLQARPRLGTPPDVINAGKLPYKGRKGHVGKGCPIAIQAGMVGESCLQRLQPIHRLGAGQGGVGIGVAAGVFAPVQRLLERAVAFGNQRQHVRHSAVAGGEPAFRVVLRQRPQHDVQALLQHLAAREHQHGYRALGGCLQQALGLVPQYHFAQFAHLPTHGQGQARTHGVGTTAERVQDGQGGHVVPSMPSSPASLAAVRGGRPGCCAPMCSCPRCRASCICRSRSARARSCSGVRVPWQ